MKIPLIYRNWEGISGQIPDKSTLLHVFSSFDFYVYLGHGAGESFFGEKDLKDLTEIKPIVMLIGCSTNKQIAEKEREKLFTNKLEMKGISLEYLLSKW